MDTSLVEVFTLAAVSVLGGEVGPPVSPGDWQVKCAPFVAEDITILIGLAGGLKGSLLLSMSTDTSLKIASRMMGSELTVVDDLSKSAVAELTNMLTGRATSDLELMGYPCKISEPTVVFGAGSEITTTPPERTVVPRATPGGEAMLPLARGAAKPWGGRGPHTPLIRARQPREETEEKQMAQVSEAAREEQLVVFLLAGESYGLDISTVQEIIPWQAVTRVPRTPSFVEGIINLRGNVIPVIDLRKRFELGQDAAQRETRIVVIEIGNLVVGLVVDGVSEVLRVTQQQVEAPPAVISGIGTEFIRGVAKTGKGLVILLDADRILDQNEQSAIAAGFELEPARRSA